MSFRMRCLSGLMVILAAAGVGTASAGGDSPNVAAITIEPFGGHAFGDQPVGAYSLPRTVVVRNAGTTTATIEDIHFIGPDAGDFSLDVMTPCAHELIATYTCSFPIFFAPKSEGPKSARLEVISDSFEGPVSIPVTGNGTPEVVPPPAAPRARFVGKPKRRIMIRSGSLKKLTVKFTANQAGSGFACSVDGKKFTTCRSPKVLSNLKPGKHSIAIRAIKDGRSGRTERAVFTVVRKK